MTDGKQAAAAADGTTEVRGAHLGWSSTGTGPLAVYAHVLGGDRWSLERAGILDWRPVSAAGRRLVRFDARGHGASTGPADRSTDPDAYRFPELARDLLDLCGKLDGVAGPIDGLGTSMGSATVLHAAVQAPHRFRRLVLTAPPTAWEGRRGQGGFYEQAASQVERDGVQSLEVALAHAPVPPAFGGRSPYVLPLRVSPAVLPAVLRGMARSDLPSPSELAAVTVPTLILAWDGDPVHPVATAERLASILPSTRLYVARQPEDLRSWGDVAAAFLTG